MVKKINDNEYDVFCGKGWNSWIRIKWANKQWHITGGDPGLMPQAMHLFQREVAGKNHAR